MKKIDFGGKPLLRPEQTSPDKWVTARGTDETAHDRRTALFAPNSEKPVCDSGRKHG